MADNLASITSSDGSLTIPKVSNIAKDPEQPTIVKSGKGEYRLKMSTNTWNSPKICIGGNQPERGSVWENAQGTFNVYDGRTNGRTQHQ
uniref:Uncharacterized protein n=1 Tax=Magallana gigas TaxID=29159 RepID=K1P0I1_MAGGI